MTSTTVATLRQFYDAMHSTIPVRRALTEQVLDGRPLDDAAIDHLRTVHAMLAAIPADADGRRLQIDEEHAMHVDLDYEIGELEKDLLFLEQGEEALHRELTARHAGFDDEVRDGLAALRGPQFQAFVTDRDGTVNNYCGRYASSVQSVYNAVFLTRFARSRTQNSVVLTSAPLADIGLADLAVTPAGALVSAGSKGREYFDSAGERHGHPIDPEQQRQLERLNDELALLLARPAYEKFTLIGSGFQLKFGQTTIARQDISHSIPAAESDGLLDHIRQLVATLDPDGAYFRIEDTGLDIEILLTVDDADGETRDFDKGDGVRFLDEDLGLGMSKGVSLICGDTGSDVPMLVAAVEMAPETRSVFVTRDDGLRERVRSVLPDAVFVNEPDALVAILDGLART